MADFRGNAIQFVGVQHESAESAELGDLRRDFREAVVDAGLPLRIQIQHLDRNWIG